MSRRRWGCRSWRWGRRRRCLPVLEADIGAIRSRIDRSIKLGCGYRHPALLHFFPEGICAHRQVVEPEVAGAIGSGRVHRPRLARGLGMDDPVGQSHMQIIDFVPFHTAEGLPGRRTCRR